jgi:hypothetical protein
MDQMPSSNPAVEELVSQMGVAMPPMQIPQLGPELAGVVGPPDPTSRTPVDPLAPPKMNAKEQRELVLDATLSKAIPPTLRRFGALAGMIPGGDRVRIHKRVDGGSLALVGDYVIRDIQTSGDVESFIDRYIKPDHGGGEYQVSILDARGGQYFVGTVTLIGASRAPGATDGVTSVLRDTLQMLQAANSRPQPAAPDPLEQFQRTKQIMDEMTTKGSDPMVAMMQIQAAAAAQQQQMLMTLLAPRQNDGVTQALTEVVRRLEAIEKAPPPLPPPSAPAPLDYVAIATAAATVLGTVANLFKREPEIRPMELVSIITQANERAAAAAGADKVTTRELLDIVRGDKERERPIPTLVEQIDSMVRVKEAMNALAPAPPPQGPQGTNFWDALVTLFGSNDFAAAIGKTVGDSMANRRLPQQVQIQQGDALVPGPVLAPQAPAPPQAPAQPEQPALEVPQGYDVLCNAIVEAKDDAARSQAVVAALQALYPIASWRPFLSTLMETIAMGDGERSLRGLGNWLKTLIVGGLVTQEAALASIGTFKEHFAVIRAGLIAQSPMLRAVAERAAPTVTPAPGPTPSAPSAPSAPAAPASDEAEDEDEDEEEPVGGRATGPAPMDVELPDEYEEH